MKPDREDVVEDEYSYPPPGKGTSVDLSKLSVQMPPLSTRRTPTRVLYTAVLDDAAIARIRAKVRTARKP